MHIFLFYKRQRTLRLRKVLHRTNERKHKGPRSFYFVLWQECCTSTFEALLLMTIKHFDCFAISAINGNLSNKCPHFFFDLTFFEWYLLLERLLQSSWLWIAIKYNSFNIKSWRRHTGHQISNNNITNRKTCCVAALTTAIVTYIDISHNNNNKILMSSV